MSISQDKTRLNVSLQRDTLPKLEELSHFFGVEKSELVDNLVRQYHIELEKNSLFNTWRQNRPTLPISTKKLVMKLLLRTKALPEASWRKNL